MSEGKVHKSEETAHEHATAAELVRNAIESAGSASRRVSNRQVQREIFTANEFLSRAERYLTTNVPEEYLDSASARIILEQTRTWRSKIEEAMENREEGTVTILDFLPQEIIDNILDLARLAEFAIHNFKDKVEPPDIVA